MAGVYLLKCSSDSGRRDFHLGDKPLNEIVGYFGITSEDREPAMPEHLSPEGSLVVVVSVREEEAEGTGFEAGYYRAAITPHQAVMRFSPAGALSAVPSR